MGLNGAQIYMIIICKWDSYLLFNSTELCVQGQRFHFHPLEVSLPLFGVSQWRRMQWLSVICCLIRVHRLLLWGPREDKPPAWALPLQLWRSWLTGPMERETVPGEVEIRLSSITRTVPPQTLSFFDVAVGRRWKCYFWLAVFALALVLRVPVCLSFCEAFLKLAPICLGHCVDCASSPGLILTDKRIWLVSGDYMHKLSSHPPKKEKVRTGKKFAIQLNYDWMNTIRTAQ